MLIALKKSSTYRGRRCIPGMQERLIFTTVSLAGPEQRLERWIRYCQRHSRFRCGGTGTSQGLPVSHVLFYLYHFIISPSSNVSFERTIFDGRPSDNSGRIVAVDAQQSLIVAVNGETCSSLNLWHPFSTCEHIVASHSICSHSSHH